jgi:hypothetical protein
MDVPLEGAWILLKAVLRSSESVEDFSMETVVMDANCQISLKMSTRILLVFLRTLLWYASLLNRKI